MSSLRETVQEIEGALLKLMDIVGKNATNATRTMESLSILVGQVGRVIDYTIKDRNKRDKQIEEMQQEIKALRQEIESLRERESQGERSKEPL